VPLFTSGGLGLGLVILVLVLLFLVMVLRIWSCLHHWLWTRWPRTGYAVVDRRQFGDAA